VPSWLYIYGGNMKKLPSFTKEELTNEQEQIEQSVARLFKTEMFRKLSEEDKKGFIQWADDNKKQANINKVGKYHPIIIDRWIELGLITKE